MKITSACVAVTLLSFAIAAAAKEPGQRGSVITATPEWEKEWSYEEGGELHTGTFYLTRSK